MYSMGMDVSLSTMQELYHLIPKSCDQAVIFPTAWRSCTFLQVNECWRKLRRLLLLTNRRYTLPATKHDPSHFSSCKSSALNINTSRMPPVQWPVVHEGDVLQCSTGWVMVWVTGAGLDYKWHLIHGFYQESYFLLRKQNCRCPWKSHGDHIRFEVAVNYYYGVD